MADYSVSGEVEVNNLGYIETKVEQIADGQISLRDHFAGLAMQEFIRECFVVAKDMELDAEKLAEGFEKIAESAYGMAERMLAEREKRR